MIRTTTVAVIVSSCLLLAVPARADDFFAEANPTTLVEKKAPSNPDRGLQLGLRAGFGLPFGKLYDADANVRGDIKGIIPIWVDAGYRLSPSVYVGAYGMYGYGLMNTSGTCGLEGVSCSGHDIRAGVNVQYHFLPKTSVDPWAGLGFGYEWLHTEGSGPGGDVSQTLRGFEIPGLQLGVDFEADTSIKLGPFIGYSVGRFDQGSKNLKTPLGEAWRTTGIANTASHQWLIFGIRGVFNI
jgi:hypothetical protein